MIQYKRIISKLLNQSYLQYRNLLVSKRSILSEAYACEDEWNKRLHSPILSSIKTSEFMTKLREKYNAEKLIDAIDVDILANKMGDLEPHQLDFSEEIFYSFRHTEDAINVIDSMPHALIRNLISRNEDERIIRMLQNKIHYGIFLDTYSANLLLNYFVKKNDTAKAAEIAYDLMYQEELGNELTQALSLYVCYQRILQLPLNAKPRILPSQTEMEIKYRKVQYIQPIWYDGHFDLPNEHAKLGSTLEMLVRGKTSDGMMKGLEIIGLGLELKFDAALKIIEDLVDDGKMVVAEELIIHFEKMLTDLKTAEKSPEVEPGLLRLVHLHPHITEEQKNNLVQQFMELKPRLSAKQLTNIKVSEEISNSLRLAVDKYQSRDILEQIKLYQRWEAEREQLVKKQIKNHQMNITKQKLAERLIQLTRTEEKLRFFEESASIEMAVAAAQESASKQVDLKMKEEEEVFVLPPGERKSAADAMKKKKK